MARTRTTPTARLTPTYGTSSGTNPAEDFESPQDLSDVAGIDAEIPRGNARPSRGLLQPKPKPRSPIGVEIGKSAGGGLGVIVALPLGAGPISGRGGINLGAGGSIKGGSLGLGFGLGPIGGSIDVGTDQDEQGRGGCYQYVTVTVGPFSHTYGRNVCEPKASPTTVAPFVTELPPKLRDFFEPKPPIYPPPISNPGFGNFGETPPLSLPPEASSGKICKIVVTRWSRTAHMGWFGNFAKVSGYSATARGSADVTYDKEGNLTGIVRYRFNKHEWLWHNPAEYFMTEEQLAPYNYNFVTNQDNPRDVATVPVFFRYQNNGLALRQLTQNVTEYWGDEALIYKIIRDGSSWQPGYPPTFDPNHSGWTTWTSSAGSITQLSIVAHWCGSQKVVLPPLSPPPPNPPPKKKMDDKCCKALMLMMLMQHKHLGVTPIPGMEQLDAFAGIKAKGEKFQTEEMAFPFEVPKVWLDPTAEPRDRLLVRNVSELLFVMASQSERLEHVLGTKEFLKDREGQLRGSETGVLNWLTSRITGISGNDFSYPDPNDFWFNTDDGIINEKKVEVRSVADAIRYLVESQNRLERILPVAEIKNSTIPARWVYPGKKGQLRVGNLIHLVEYMFRADDRARGFWPQTVKIKDANPAIKGDQKIELKFESQADMLREILKFLIDTEGDGDISNNFALRSAIQNCQQHQLLVQNNAMLDAIVEYMDFKIDRTKTKVPMPFSPFAGHQPNLFDQLLTKLGFGNKQIPGSIDKNTEEAVEALFEGVLQNTEVEVPIIKANEKKSMNEAFIEILKHASAASAAVSERVGEGALKRLVDSAGISQAVSRFLLKRDIAESNGVGDLDQWINSAEAGYTDKPESSSLRFPESDPLEPYDRPIAENPRIREIDTKDPKAD